jgi:hypothetical protein
VITQNLEEFQECFLLGKKASSMKAADLRDMFRKASKNVCTLNVVSPDPLSPTPSTCSALKSRKHRRGL